MAPPVDRLIETLTETRAKLEEELGRVEAYRALRQLEQREASGERLSIVSAERLRETLEAELSGNHYLNARRKLDEALALLGAWDKADPAPEPPATAEPPTEPREQLVESAGPHKEPDESALDVLAAAAARPMQPGDDLSLIRDLPSACVSVVSAAGFNRYEALASIDSKGVAMLERMLGQSGIVSRGNWIEQAAMLATGRETRYAARLIARRAGEAWPPPAIAPDLMPAVEIQAEVRADPPGPASAEPRAAVEAPAAGREADSRLDEPNDLTNIAGIDADMAQRLAALGVSRYAAIAAWTADEVAAVMKALALGDRTRIGSWIEQAAVLAAGRPTRFVDSRSIRPVVAVLPPVIEIPLDIESLAVESPAATTLEHSPEPILVSVPANDDGAPYPPAPAEIAASSASRTPTGKPAALRPPKRPQDRTDRVFDDVAALVARTVETARHVGGMTERAGPQETQQQVAASALRPASSTTTAEVPFRPAAPVSARLAAAAETEPAPATPAPPRAIVSPGRGPGQPVPKLPASLSAGLDTEASIEIRPRIAGTPVGRTDAPARGPNDPARAQSSPAPRAPGTPRRPEAGMASRSGPAAAPKDPVRQRIVIDEIAGARSDRNGHRALETLADASAQRAGGLTGLVGRFVKALRGDKTG
ncbi:MAG: hypothetical protein R3D57_18445 [Hyphomicrobiaceae bacterium]